MPPPKGPLPLPPGIAPPPGQAVRAKSTKTFKVSTGIVTAPQKIAMFGPGGVGKTELCALMKLIGVDPVYIDLEDGTKFLDVARINEIETWEDLRTVVQNSKDGNGYDALVIDSFTKAQELAQDWVIRNVPHEKGSKHKVIKNIEDYGFGKGLSHIYDACLLLLSDLDSVVRSGKHVVLIAHECVTSVPNPQGEDWIRYEPRLQSPPKGQYSVRHRVKEWCDHLLYVGFDAFISERKGTGSGTRSIYPFELPSHWAKSRSLDTVIPYERGNPELWKQLFQKGN